MRGDRVVKKMLGDLQGTVFFPNDLQVQDVSIFMIRTAVLLRKTNFKIFCHINISPFSFVRYGGKSLKCLYIPILLIIININYFLVLTWWTNQDKIGFVRIISYLIITFFVPWNQRILRCNSLLILFFVVSIIVGNKFAFCTGTTKEGFKILSSHKIQ